jgi:beta-glucosidase-like glycosyl hydrolase
MKLWVFVFCFLISSVSSLLPPPLPLICLPVQPQGCYNDSFTRTFPHQMNNGPGDPFYDNSTLETCAYLCSISKDGPFPYAAVENGGQCFCANKDDLDRAQANRTADEECNTPCNGFPLVTCGGQWRLQAYSFTCEPYIPGSFPWQNSSLPISDRVTDLIARLSPLQLIAQLTQNGADVYAKGVQLPRYIVSQECLAGFDGGDIYIAPPVTHTASSGFPQPVNLGNTWDETLVREIASAISDEARAAFIHLQRPSLTCMSPNLNVNRAPQWGRNLESYSEDPTLIATLGSAYITGIQLGTLSNASAAASGYLKIMAIPKHLGAYSVECYNSDGSPNNYPNCDVYRNTFNAIVSEMDLRETYFVGWEAAVSEANAQGVMASYNEINGIPSTCNGELLRDILYNEWGLDGFVISDADAVALEGFVPDQSWQTGGHNFTSSLLESAISALINGTTISLEDTDPESAAYALMLPLALSQGRINLSTIEEAARRALTPRFRVGLYDPIESVPWNNVSVAVIESEEHHLLARRAAAQSYVLLKNDNILPLQNPQDGGPITVAVIGNIANCSDCSVNRYSGHPNISISFFEGITAAVSSRGGNTILASNFNTEAINAVVASDVAIIILTGESEGESMDRQHIGLPAEQIAFFKTLALSNSNTPLVSCIVSGGAVDSSEAVEASQAILALYMGGMEAGSALADVLYGDVNPSGVLAHTIYRRSWENASNFLDMSLQGPPGRGYRYLSKEDTNQHVLFPFGFGGSYTQWNASITSVVPSTISISELNAGANVTVIVTIRNTGLVIGTRVSYIFLSLPEADPSMHWPVNWLARKGFTKLHNIGPGESAEAILTISARDLSRWIFSTKAFVVQTGNFSLIARDALDGESSSLIVTAT